jgi:type IV pilus assembly protein PilW
MKGKKMINCAKGFVMARATACRQGFTLIELLVYIAISGVVLGSIFTAYLGQLHSHVTQRQIVDMQQNLRAALYMMNREIKMAGYNPSGAPGIGISIADTDRLVFSMDYTGASDGPATGGLQQTVEYTLSANGNLLRNGEVMALNIDALDFVYIGSDGNSINLDKDGNPIKAPVSATDIVKIRAIQVTLVGRSGTNASALMYKQVDNRNYLNQQGQEILSAQNDNFRRFLLTTEVRCRNLDL